MAATKWWILKRVMSLNNIGFPIEGKTYKIKFRFGVYAFQDPTLVAGLTRVAWEIQRGFRMYIAQMHIHRRIFFHTSRH